MWEGVRGVSGGLAKENGRRVSAEDVERGAWVVEMVREMGLEGAAVVEKEEVGGAVGKGEGDVGIRAGDVDITENTQGAEYEETGISSAKDAGEQDNRASTRASARQKRKIPPPASPPAATTKKSKKASKASTRSQAGELATIRLPREPADANEGDGSRILPQRRRPTKASCGGKAPQVPLEGPSCVWGAAHNTSGRVRFTESQEAGIRLWTVYTAS